MKNKIISVLQYLFFLGLGVFLVVWSLRKVEAKDWDEIWSAFDHTRYIVILPVTLAMLASHLSRAIRWKILIAPLDYKPRLSNIYLSILIGYLANLAVPRLGEILKCTFLARYEKIPANKLIGTIVAERAFDVITLLLVMALTFFFNAEIIGNYLYGLLQKLAGGETSSPQEGFGFGLLILLGLLLAIVLVFWIFRHSSFVEKAKLLVIGVWHGLTSIRKIEKRGWFLFHSLFIFAMYLISIQIGMYALPDISKVSMASSLSMLSTGSIAMILTPSGIGAYPLFIQETLLLYGVKSSLGLAFGWLMWTVQFFIILFSGFIALGLFPTLNKKKQHA